MELSPFRKVIEARPVADSIPGIEHPSWAMAWDVHFLRMRRQSPRAHSRQNTFCEVTIACLVTIPQGSTKEICLGYLKDREWECVDNKLQAKAKAASL